MSGFESHLLARTESISVWDVVCPGQCGSESAEECSYATHLVLPYSGIFRHHVGRGDWVIEPNQLLFINADQPYRVSHPVTGGDRSVSIEIALPVLDELVATAQRRQSQFPALPHHRLTLPARAQRLAALLRHKLRDTATEALEAESHVVDVVSACVGARGPSGSRGLQKLADRAKIVLASDLSRRWSLADIGTAVGVSPIYLTQVFKRVESIPLYQYQLRLRLAHALKLVPASDDLTGTALDLGFSSHSHFTSIFSRAFGITPAAMREQARPRAVSVPR